MTKQSAVCQNTLTRKTPWQKFKVGFLRNWQLYLLLLGPIIYMILFEYIPLFGLQIAFKDYRTRRGIFGSEWVAFQHFETFFGNYKWVYYVRNTFVLAMYSILASFPVPIILALMLHVNENKVLKKITQNLSYVPHFISIVVMVGILNRIFDPVSGIYGTIADWLGISGPKNLLASAEAFPHMYVWSGVWQNMGWSAIIYVSALGAASPELHEAARIDGASRWRRVWVVDIPAILPIMCIQLIQRMGGILNVGYEKVYLMQNDLNLKASEVISTYVYKYGIGQNNLSYGTAVSMMNSVVSTVMVLIVNWVVNKLSDNEYGLF